MELHHKGVYQGGEYFDFRGDDDVWVFINGKLAMDLGGVQNEVHRSFALDDMVESHNLQLGSYYEFDFFYTERITPQSNIGITTNILTPQPVDSVKLFVEPDDTIQAGDTATAWALVYNDTGAVKSGFGDKIQWSFVQSGGHHDSTLSSTTGDTTHFVPTEAHQTVIIQGTLLDTVSGRYLRDSLTVYILPDDPHHLVIENTDIISGAALVNDQPVDTVIIPADRQTTSAYAILRDQYGNFTGYSAHTDWDIIAGTVLSSVSGTDNGTGKGTITKFGQSGIGMVQADDRDYDGAMFIDSVVVEVLNEAPTANDDIYSIIEDATLVVPGPSKPTLIDNDSDPDPSAVLTAQLVTDVTQGVLSLNNDGSFTYIPSSNFSGTVEFTYRVSDGELVSNIATVSIFIGSDNDPPLAINDTYQTTEDIPLTVNALNGVLSNDNDHEGSTLSAILVSPPSASLGTVSLNTDGSFTFVPVPQINGNVVFSYQAFDGELYSPVALVTITVIAVNDPPVAIDDIYSGFEDTPLSISVNNGVLINDSDPENNVLTLELLTNPSSGTLVLNQNGSFSLTPAANQTDTLQFTYRISDGTLFDTARVTLTFEALNDAPVARNDVYSINEDDTLSMNADSGVLSNDTDVDLDTLQVILVEDVNSSMGTLNLESDGSFDFYTAPDFNGTAFFRYQITDGKAFSSVVTVFIVVSPVQDEPNAFNDTYTTGQNENLIVGAPGVIDNDRDPDNDPLSALLINQPASGTVILASDGSFSYEPPNGFSGTVSFNYQLSDPGGLKDTARATIIVGSGAAAPVAVNDTFSIMEDTPLIVTAPGVLENDIYAQSLTMTLTSGTGKGLLQTQTDGSFLFTPPANYTGQISFTYLAADGDIVSNQATVIINVTPVNDKPVAGDDSYQGDEDVVMSVPGPGYSSILNNDFDRDNDPLTTTLLSSPSTDTAIVSLNTTGSFVFTPAANFTGVTSFQYTISDGNLLDTAVITLYITSVNDTPFISEIPNQVVDRGTQFSSLDLDDYTSDVDNNNEQLTWTVLDNEQVTLSINSTTHVVTAQPIDSTWYGTDSVTIRVTDPSGYSFDRIVVFEITNPNQLPAPVTDTVQGTIRGNDFAMNLRVHGHSDASIYFTYTIDGSLPDQPAKTDSVVNSQSILTFGPFAQDSVRVRIRAIAEKYPYLDSKVSIFNYLVSFPQLPEPVVTPGPGVFTLTHDTLSIAVPGHADAIIYYTTDGSDPQTSSTRLIYHSDSGIVTGPFEEAALVNLKVFATK